MQGRSTLIDVMKYSTQSGVITVEWFRYLACIWKKMALRGKSHRARCKSMHIREELRVSYAENLKYWMVF